MNGPGEIPLTHSNSTPNTSSCSLISIIPNLGMSSCRGRAEAFARSLSSKLRTLGTQNDEKCDTLENEPVVVDNDEDLEVSNATTTTAAAATAQEQAQDDETVVTTAVTTTTTSLNVNDVVKNSWKDNGMTVNVSVSDTGTGNVNDTDTQTMRTENDSFFDFDCELESPGSPVDECEYLRLIESTSNTPHNSLGDDNCISSSSLSARNISSGGSNISNDEFDVNINSEDVSVEDNNLHNGHNGTENHHENQNDEEEQKEGEEEDQTENVTILMNGHAEKAEENSQNEMTLKAEEENEVTKIETAENPIKSAVNENEHTEVIKMTETYNNNNNSNNNTNHNLEKDVKTESTSTIITDEIKAENQTESNNNNKNNYTNNNNENVNESETKKKNSFQNCGLDTTDDEDECRPQRVRRCSSLKTGKTPPGTPGRKKIVRFADKLGLDLADIKTFLDEIPNIPKSAFEDLEINENEPPIQLGPRSDKLLVPLFQQPGGLTTFLDLVRERQVSLENAAVTDHINQTISGSVRVRNLDFHKSVHIRYTLDHWRTFVDLKAQYVDNSCDGFSDKFTFIIYGNSLQVGQRIEFAVRFQCKGQQFWDNNYGTNYCFQCLPATNATGNNNTTITTNSTHAAIITHHHHHHNNNNISTNNSTNVAAAISTITRNTISHYSSVPMHGFATGLGMLMQQQQQQQQHHHHHHQHKSQNGIDHNQTNVLRLLSPAAGDAWCCSFY